MKKMRSDAARYVHESIYVLAKKPADDRPRALLGRKVMRRVVIHFN